MGFWEPLFFWVLALGAVVTSIALLSFRNPLYSALALIADFFCFAGLYAMLSAHFLAITQILVYAGAIMVLFVFIIMLLNLSEEEIGPRRFNLHHLLALAAGLFIFGVVAATILSVVGEDRVVRNRKAAGIAAEMRAQAGSITHRIAKRRRDERIAAAENAKQRRKLKRQPVPPPPAYRRWVKTPSLVPGLYADVSEWAVTRTYQDRLRRWDAGVTSPANGEYRPFDPNREFEVPPVLRPGSQAMGGEVRERDEREEENLFGTVEPISVLLVNRFVVPFELTAVLLLAAIFGAVIIAKKRL